MTYRQELQAENERLLQQLRGIVADFEQMARDQKALVERLEGQRSRPLSRPEARAYPVAVR